MSKTKKTADPDNAQPDLQAADSPAPDSAITAQDETALADPPQPEAKLADPAAPNDGAEAHHPEDEHEEHHVSLAARSLQILAILLLGATLALWLAPRIAPHLPAGMSGLARWLAPGASLAEEQVAQLRAEIAALHSQQAPALDMAEIDARIAATDRSAELRESIAALASRLETVEAAPVALAAQLGSLDSRLAGAEAMLASLDADLRDLVTAGLALDSQAAADIAAYGATIDGLRARLADLDDRLLAQSAQIDAVTAEIRAEAQSAVDSAAAAQANSELQAALIALEAALADGLPYGGTLDWLETTQGATIPLPLAAGAESGVISIARLLADFPPLAHAAIRTDIRESGDDSALGQFGAFLQSQVAARSLTPQEGTSTDAILSRAEDALRQGDLELALRHMRTLSVPAADIYADWLAAARVRHAALGGFAALKSALGGGVQ